MSSVNEVRELLFFINGLVGGIWIFTIFCFGSNDVSITKLLCWINGLTMAIFISTVLAIAMSS